MASTMAKLRTARGLTQGQAAAALGISRAHYVNIENGKRAPSISLTMKMARYYECSVESLLIAPNMIPSDRVFRTTASSESCPKGLESAVSPIMNQNKMRGAKNKVAIQDKLKDLSNLDGFAGVGVFSPNGESISIVGNTNQFPLQKVGAIVSTVLTNAQKACEEMEAGREQMVHLATGNAHVLVKDFNESVHPKFAAGRPQPYLVLVLTSDSSIGLAKMRMASIMTKLADEVR